MKNVSVIVLVAALLGYGLSGLSPLGAVQAQKPTPPPTSPPSAPTKPPPEPTQAPEPTKAPASTEKPPPIEPTKAPTETPSPALASTPLPTSTPEPAKPVVESTPTPDPAKPTVAPSPTPGPTGASPTDDAAPVGERASGTPMPDAPTSGTPRADGASFDDAPTVTPLPVVTGLVFDDRDGDGTRGSDEPGVGGVPVVLDGQVVGVTDAGGYFNLPLADPGRVLLSIVPPEGWQWRGEPLNAGDENVVIPLHRLEPAEASAAAAKATTTATVAGSVIVAALLAFDGAAALLQAMAARSLAHTYRRQKVQEMEFLQEQTIARRKAEVEQVLAETDDWRRVLAQVVADAVPDADVAWLNVTNVSATPAPRFDVAGEDGRRYTFTVAPGAIREQPVLRLSKIWRMGRAIPLDASLSPAIRVEVQTVWDYLAKQNGLELRLLPRRAGWYLVAQKQRGKDTR